ncbi:MAG: formate dehydrogenase accessory sulfurtransferase FdhD [Pseudomonadota bacterium]
MNLLARILGDAGRPASHRALPVRRYVGDEATDAYEEVAAETAVAFVYNGTPHAVMMASPSDLEEFGVGFTVTERIVARREEIRSVRARELPEGIELAIEIDPERHRELDRRQRALTGRVGCGLCGQQSLAQAIRKPERVARGLRVSHGAVHAAVAELPRWQAVNRVTGALHAAAWVGPEGEVLAVREDVGRHNAFDKLIGCLLNDRADLDKGFALITSRASHEMVQKAASVGIQMLVAVSAPTTLAVRLASETGVTLIAFARNNRYTVYSGSERIVTHRETTVV